MSARPSFMRLLLGSLIALLAAFIAPASALAIDEFPVSPGSGPAGITVGPDGAIWFTEETGNRIGRITTAGVVTEFPPLPAGSSIPSEIVTGPDGNLWFTEQGAPSKIARMTTAGVLTEFDLQLGSGPDGITVGPDGMIWFTEFQQHRIGKIDPFNPGTPSNPNVQIFTTGLTSNSGPGDITTGPDGRLWFTEVFANQIGAITTNGSIQEFGPTAGGPSAIAASAGALWFTQGEGNQIGRISTTGVITAQFTVPTAGSGPSGIAFGPAAEGALWFTESNTNKIGRMTTGGSFTEFPVATTAAEGPDGIVLGPDGFLWFTMKGASKIGRIQAGGGGGGVVPPPPPPVAQTAKPSVLSLGVSPKRFKAAPRGSSISAKVGATVRYRLSVAASTRFTVERESAGRKKGKKCVKPTRKLRRAKRCKLYKAVRGSFTHKGKAGSNSFKFTGRVGNKKLRPGSYRLVAVATTAAGKSAVKQATFKIVKR